MVKMRPVRNMRLGTSLCRHWPDIVLLFFGLFVISHCILMRQWWSVANPINGHQLVGEAIDNPPQQRIGTYELLLKAQRLLKDRRGVMLKNKTDYSDQNRPLDILVFFPIYGLKKTSVQNDKKDIERFVIQAWTSIADAWSQEGLTHSPSVRVVAFVETEEDCYPDFQDLSTRFRCLPLPAKCIHPEFHIPTMDCLFSTAQILAAPSELLFYANSDIVFPAQAISAISSILEQFDEETRVVIVGQRTEIHGEALPSSFSVSALQEILAHAEKSGVLYSPYGLDYFVFTPGAFPRNYPPYLLGRWRWDSALLADSVLTNDVATVDATATILAVHVGVTTDLTPAHYTGRLGSDYNDDLVKQEWGAGYFLGRTDNTHYVHSLNGTASYRLLPRLLPANATEVVPIRRGIHIPSSDLREERALVQLVLVYPGMVSEALKMACIAEANNDRLGLPPHITFLTVDEKSYKEMAARYPNAVIREPTDSLNAVGTERVEWQRMARKTVTRLVKDKVTVILVEASNPHWFMGRSEEFSRIGKLMDDFVRTCDVTLYDANIFSVRPTLGGLRYLQVVKRCESSAGRKTFLDNVAYLSDGERQFFAGSMDACLNGFKDGALMVENEDYQHVSICQLEQHMPSPTPLSENITQGRLWSWHAQKRQCTTRRQEEKIESATIALKSATLPKAPVDDTLHVVVAVSNPCGLTSRYALAERTVARLGGHTTVYVVELAYGNQPFHLTNELEPRHLQLRTELPMWHKENLVNLAVEKLLPPDWKAMAWVDGDVEFDNPSWALETLRVLNGQKDVVQLFSHAVFMDAVENTLAVFTGYAYNFVRGREYEGVGRDLWHPGFGWAYSRSAFDQAGGMYEREISGHGDGVIAHCMKGGYDWDSYYMKFSSDGHREAILAYNASCAGLRMGYTSGAVRHFYHGNYADRKYMERRLVFDKLHFDPTAHLQRDNVTGVLIPAESFPASLVNSLNETCYKKVDDGDISLFFM